MGYLKRNIVPGHWRRKKNGKCERNPGYDVRPGSTYASRRYFKLTGVPVDTWYKPRVELKGRKSKRAQSKPNKGSNYAR